MPASRKYCKGWCDRVGRALCAPERESYEAVILSFIARRVLMLADSGAHGLRVAFHWAPPRSFCVWGDQQLI